MESSQGIDEAQAPPSTPKHGKPRGGWITFPFILAATMGMTLASGGWITNLIVYLIQEYKVKNIDAAQISNLVNGFVCLIPVIAAVIADSFIGCYSVIVISTCICVLGTILLLISALLHPSQKCGDISSNCETPSQSQFAILYSGIVLATLGIGGPKSSISTMGADQFKRPKEQSIFFNWFFFTWYVGTLIAVTLMVYVEDNVSWSWGFGICVGVNVLALVIFLLGTKFYRHVKPEGSPFTEITRVVVATIRKRKVQVSTESEDYYYGDDEGMKNFVIVPPTKSFKFLNRAALRTEGDTNSDGSIAKRWRLCIVQQVEDLKVLIRVVPLWTSSAFLHTPIAIQAGLSVLQALVMDRRIGPHFKISAGSVLVFVLVSTAAFLAIFDCFFRPAWKHVVGRPLTHLQRIGIGHVLNVASMAISAIVESKRLNIAHSKNPENLTGFIAPMSVLWLIPQLAVVGLGEAFHYPGQTEMYYEEFPMSLKTLATAMISLIIAVAYYLSTALIDLVRNVSTWLPDDLNQGRLDLVYWVISVIGVVNFGYFLVCAWLYKYRVKVVPADNSSSSDQVTETRKLKGGNNSKVVRFSM